MAKGEGKVVAQNKKAHHDYTIVDTLEAGKGRKGVYDGYCQTQEQS